jgi:hypothetical protein
MPYARRYNPRFVYFLPTFQFFIVEFEIWFSFFPVSLNESAFTKVDKILKGNLDSIHLRRQQIFTKLETIIGI